ncbi:ribonuclease H-like domain-containing protein [Tanacetum coccineum]
MNYVPVSVENQVTVDAGIQESYVAGSSGSNKETPQEYILLPLHSHGPRISAKDVAEKEEQHNLREAEQALKDELERMIAQEIAAKTIDDATRQAFEEEKKRATQATSINKLNTGRPSISASNSPLVRQIPIDESTLPNADLPIDPNMHDLEDDSNIFPNNGIFSRAYDDEDVGAETDFNNMDNTIDVSPIPTLRVHKDHPKGQILGDPKSSSNKERSQRLSFSNNKLCNARRIAPVQITEGFVDPAHPHKVYKVVKALYGLHQAPRAWYETLSTFLLENGFRRGLQVKEQPDGIFIIQDKYVADILKKFDFCFIKTATTPIVSNKPLVKDVDVHIYRHQVHPKASHLNAVKRIFRYLKHQPKLGLWYPRDSPFELEAFSNNNYRGASLDRKSTIGGCQFLSRRLISWQCEKQTIMTNSTTEAEYVTAANCCGQIQFPSGQHWDVKSVAIFEERINCKDIFLVFGLLLQYRQAKVSTNKLDESTAEPDEGTAKPNEGTAKPNEGTAEPNEGTAEPKDGNSDESAAPTTIFRDDETIAQFLVTMSQNKTKQKGVEIKEIKDTDRPRTTTERSILTLKPLPKIDPKDKGKKVLEEKAESDAESEGVNEVERKFAQLANDEEVARKVQEEWEAEEEKKKLAEEEATKAAFTNEYDYIQARLNADEILAEKLQEEEREKFTIEQRAKLLHDTIAVQRRFLAQQRSEAIRNKLPLRNQLRNQMMTYLKHVGGYKHAQLNKKKFEEIQTLYERQKKFDQSFIPIDSTEDERQIREMNKKAAETDTSKKRKSGSRVKRIFKRRKTDSDVEEKEKLKSFLNVEPDEDKAINYEVLQTRFLIVEWESKFYDYGHYGRELIYYRVIRADGIKTFSEMVKLFDRMDLVEIHSLVMKRFATTTPEGIDLLLWGDLKTMFESNTDDELWKNQEEWNLLSWEFHENCRVHVLRLEDGTEINMLAERRYPLTKDTLERMLDLRLTVISDDDAALDLLRFIEKQIAELEKSEGNNGDGKDL